MQLLGQQRNVEVGEHAVEHVVGCVADIVDRRSHCPQVGGMNEADLDGWAPERPVLNFAEIVEIQHSVSEQEESWVAEEEGQ